MLKMVDGTGIIGVDMVCPLGGAVSPPQPPNYDNIEMEGVGSLMLPNSLKAPLERLELIGNSTQGENPSPDNPQEIKSAGKWNEEKQKYEIDVKVTNSEQGWTEEQTLTLTFDRPITKWDKLVEQDGQIGWLYQSVAKEYIGDNSVELYDTGFYFKLSGKKIVNGEGYCKELKQYVHREENPCIAFKMSANIYAYTLNTQEIYGSTVSEIKEYLKSHPLHLVYKTEATEFVPLSESEQTQLRNLHSYNGTTHITVDSGEVPCGIKLTYRKEK